MTQLFNPQTIAFSANAQTTINIGNPSSNKFMYVWAFSISGANTACNVGFFNGNGGGTLGGYQSIAAGTALTEPGLGTGGPVFTVDPNINFVISNPNTALLGGWVRISN